MSFSVDFVAASGKTVQHLVDILCNNKNTICFLAVFMLIIDIIFFVFSKLTDYVVYLPSCSLNFLSASFMVLFSSYFSLLDLLTLFRLLEYYWMLLSTFIASTSSRKSLSLHSSIFGTI